MAVPKRRTSKSKKGMRSAHRAIRVPSLARCARCNQPVMPHQVCANCGYYGRRKVVEIKET
ncbi:MAG: 50S ribosomal protein L32 [Planctomycetota bacterium]